MADPTDKRLLTSLQLSQDLHVCERVFLTYICWSTPFGNVLLDR
jgi:hypothetical protein